MPSVRSRRRSRRLWSGAGTLGAVLTLFLGGTPAYGASEQGGGGTLADKLHEKEILSDEEYEELKHRDNAIDKMVVLLKKEKNRQTDKDHKRETEKTKFSSDKYKL